MLADAEDPQPTGNKKQTTEDTNAETTTDPPVRRKAKTKIGNKSKKKRSKKATSKFPDGEVSFNYRTSKIH